MLTDPDDLVVDIFGGSNTTGQVAEVESRRWVAFEALPEYVAASSFRFLEKDTPLELMKSIYSKIVAGESINIEKYLRQTHLSPDTSRFAGRGGNVWSLTKR
jgi:site-specific DNA-methyltransferase (cytosine-N4-specific)